MANNVNIIFIAIQFLSLITLTQPFPCRDGENIECDYCLSQNDFESGTNRLIQPGLYCITENITFNPMPTDATAPNIKGSWFPDNDLNFPGCIEQSNGAYALGFFAVISIETNNIKLDINEYTIAYHKHYYLQQRFGSIIEISNSPFLPNTGPANFGNSFVNIENITICNGNLGLTSHHGIHANNASNIVIQNINVFDFEVAGLQFNGFTNVILQNVDIGPSLNSVPLTAYYSNARFLILALRRLLTAINTNQLSIPSVSFEYLNGESLTLEEIYTDLITAMDIMFRYCTDTLTENDRNNNVYLQSLNLFRNYDSLPDGSALYGIVLNSFSVAVNGFGDSQSIAKDIIMRNVNIHGLKLKVNEVIAMYFDKCDMSERMTVLKGPFGDVIDIRKMIDRDLWYLIDEYDSTNMELKQLKYIGNPLSNAQIALFMYRDYIADGENYAFGSYLNERFINWAVYGDVWPECAAFVCNGDLMFHTNKGVIGVRMDGIENAQMSGVSITDLENRSPLVSSACASYTGPHDGGNPGTRMQEGGMSTDVRALSVIHGDLSISGNNNDISDIYSWYGDVAGIDLMGNSILWYDGMVDINSVSAASKVTEREYQNLLTQNKTPFPNNFNVCTLKRDESSEIIKQSSATNLGSDNCEIAQFQSITLPNMCTARCDAFSVLLERKEYNGENVCLTYGIQRLFDDGFCKKNIRNIVLGVCSDDYGIVTTQDLTGLVDSINTDAKNVKVWGDSDNILGMHVSIVCSKYQRFTICLKDVFNVDDHFSHQVKFKRGERNFVCEESYTVGLPCIDPNKFESGSYADSGLNKQYEQYKGKNKRNYRKGNQNSAMGMMEERDSLKINTFGQQNPYIAVIISVTLIVFCLCCMCIMIFLCAKRRWNVGGRKTMERDRATYVQTGMETNMCADEQDNIVGYSDIDECDDMTQLTQTTITGYEEIYCDKTKHVEASYTI